MRAGRHPVCRGGQQGGAAGAGGAAVGLEAECGLRYRSGYTDRQEEGEWVQYLTGAALACVNWEGDPRGDGHQHRAALSQVPRLARLPRPRLGPTKR